MITELPIVKTVTRKPEGTVIYSKSGLGKTTFGCHAVKAAKNGLMIQCGEDGLSDSKDPSILDTPHLKDIIGSGTTSDELIEGWKFFKEEVLKFLMLKDHKIDLVFFDNFDNIIKNNLEAFVVKEYYKNDLTKANAWGGAKYVEMDGELSLIIKAFEFLQKRGMAIVISCHNQLVSVKDPIVDDYNRYTLDVPGRKDADLRGRIINWSSATIFGTRDIIIENKKIVGDKRVLKTIDCASWDAKNRFGLPETIDFSYEAFKKELNR